LIIHRMQRSLILFCFILMLSTGFTHSLAQEISVTRISGDLMQWHRVTLGFDGLEVSETEPETFWNYRLLVTFTNGSASYTVPGFYAADGDAAHSGATSGNQWQAHFTPDAIGEWTYTASFRTGDKIAISLDENAGSPLGFDGATGTFTITESTAPESDFRYHGMLRYVGEHYLQFAGSGQYYLKAGADSPENFLAYYGFDGTYDTGGIIDNFLHRYSPHQDDWRDGDPTWGTDNRGKEIIGALNYLADQGVNSFYFITYNLDGGDGADTWMWTDHEARDTFDVSKLAQWEIVFSHMTSRGIQLHLLTQETENDRNLGGDGNLNDIRKLYYRELVARFAHHPALQWNLGEENNNSVEQLQGFADYIRALDPYDHPIAVHSHYNAAATRYPAFYGLNNFEATSIQGTATSYNGWAINFREASAAANRPWVIYGDEQGPAVESDMSNVDQLRREALWGNLMGGGAGVEWYFGYQGDFGDMQSEDFRVAQPLWEDTAHAVDFFQTYLPFHEMIPANDLVGSAFGFAKPGDTYVIYLPVGGTTNLILSNNSVYDVFWYNPRTGGDLQMGDVSQITGHGSISIGNPPSEPGEDWVVLVRLNQEANIAPIIEPLTNITMTPGSSLTIPITVTDPDGESISLSVNALEFVGIQDNGDGTGRLTINYPVDGDSRYQVLVTALDTAGGRSVAYFTLSSENETGYNARVTQFVLMDAARDTDIRVLEAEDTIDPASIASGEINIRVETDPPIVGSVVIGINELFRTENTAPYAVWGDDSGDFTAWTPIPGTYTLSATPYSQSGAGGEQGQSLTITLTVSSP